jgi:hypothetical protein
MNTFIKGNASACIAVFLFCFSTSYSQLNVPFKMRYQSFVKGDMTVIANNITNRVGYNTGTEVPYYNHTNSANLNDEFTMDYIDIDNDEATFSSSSAELFFNGMSNKKILYAGLYWSATYKYNSGYQKKENKFVADDPTRDAFNQIKIKFPNQEKYTDITGQIIFDGLKDKEYIEYAPYAVYADITDYIKELTNPAGVYTVANVKATKGMISGGVAAGWTIFFVYEDNQMSGKFITSFDGFAGVTEKTTDILFNGFETLPQGTVNAKIACAALEGDNNLIGDQLLFNASGKREFIALNNTIRKTGNFFNSCITIEDKYFTNRFPDSKNTLGYDTCLITIPNLNNSVISNNTKEATLRLKSTGDRYFMFFTAFNVEVTNPSLINKDDTLFASNSIEPAISKDIFSNRTIKYIPANTDMLVDAKTNVSTRNRMAKSAANVIEIQKTNMTNQPSGYYLLAHIYKTELEAKAFIYYMNEKNIKVDFFTNPLNNYKYAFLEKVNNEQEAIDLYDSNMNDTFQERIQILAINIENATTTIAANKSIKPLQIIEKNDLANKEKYDIQVVKIANQPKGYYIVGNVFAVNQNSTNFYNLLKSKGLNPKILINPVNNFKYVYLKKVDSEKEAIDLFLSKVNNTYHDKIWILSVNNNDTNTDITNNDD